LKGCCAGSLVKSGNSAGEKLIFKSSILAIPAILAIRKRAGFYERNRNVTVRRLQRAELLHHQEQEDDYGPAGVQEVLQAVPQAHRA
jgi:hypothetical protein